MAGKELISVHCAIKYECVGEGNDHLRMKNSIIVFFLLSDTMDNTPLNVDDMVNAAKLPAFPVLSDVERDPEVQEMRLKGNYSKTLSVSLLDQ
jgi:hypothetical protein